MARYNSTFATTAESNKYLFCDGSTFDASKYPKLYKVLGTNILPDLRKRYLQGNIIGGKYLEPGLPNITGTFAGGSSSSQSTASRATGAFYPYSSGFDLFDAGDVHVFECWKGFDASRSNPIYGASDTVRPPSMTVLYYIRAK